MISLLRRTVRSCLVLILAAGPGACALFQDRDPLTVNVIGIEPLPGQELELRMAVKIRVQNPNEQPVDFDGLAVELKINGEPLAAGVSGQHGHIGRYDDQVIVVPVSVTAFSILRQAYGLERLQGSRGVPYELKGKMAGGALGTLRFSDNGVLELPGLTTLPGNGLR